MKNSALSTRLAKREAAEKALREAPPTDPIERAPNHNRMYAPKKVKE